jgi:hypothetical protein
MSRRSYRRSTRHKPRYTLSKPRALRRLLRACLIARPDRDDDAVMLAGLSIAATAAGFCDG